jgi:hypothetical protein
VRYSLQILRARVPARVNGHALDTALLAPWAIVDAYLATTCDIEGAGVLMKKPAIRRQLDEKRFDDIARDFGFLFDQVRKSAGDLNVELRGDYFTVYCEGNIVCAVIAKPGMPYRADIGAAFLPKTKGLRDYVESRLGLPLATSGYQRITVDAKSAAQLLQGKHVRELCAAIRQRRYGEEITVEQAMLADNPPTPGFLLIDRQIADTRWPKRMDLLALRRRADGRYGFAVLELKLGKNAALESDVAAQLDQYVEHIRRDEPDAYRECYEAVYKQKRALELIPSAMPEAIEIDPSDVEGLVVVVGYSQRATDSVAALRSAHGSTQVIWFRNRLVDENGRYRELV